MRIGVSKLCFAALTTALVAGGSWGFSQAGAGASPVPMRKIQGVKHPVSDVPVRRGNQFVYRDGTRILATDHSGRSGVANADGSITYADHMVVYHDPRTGLVFIDPPDSPEHLANQAGLPVMANGVITFPDGTTVKATGTGKNSGLARINPDGSVSFPDGTNMTHNSLNGDNNLFFPGGGTTYDNWRTGQHSSNGAHFNPQAPEASESHSSGEASSSESEPVEHSDDNGPEHEDHDKPEGTDKGGKGLVVNGDGPGGNGFGVKPKGNGMITGGASTNDAPNKPNGQAPSGPPKPFNSTFGPGGRPPVENNVSNHVAHLGINVGSFSIDPDPNAMRGAATPTVIDPHGGHIG